MEWNGRTFGYRNISSTSQIAIAGGGGPDKGYKIIGMGPSASEWRVRFLGWREEKNLGRSCIESRIPRTKRRDGR